jgi:hypothetical protein
MKYQIPTANCLTGNTKSQIPTAKGISNHEYQRTKEHTMAVLFSWGINSTLPKAPLKDVF